MWMDSFYSHILREVFAREQYTRLPERPSGLTHFTSSSQRTEKEVYQALNTQFLSLSFSKKSKVVKTFTYLLVLNMHYVSE